jgi:hypothetical protein
MYRLTQASTFLAKLASSTTPNTRTSNQNPLVATKQGGQGSTFLSFEQFYKRAQKESKHDTRTPSILLLGRRSLLLLLLHLLHFPPLLHLRLRCGCSARPAEPALPRVEPNAEEHDHEHSSQDRLLRLLSPHHPPHKSNKSDHKTH